jgi:hypothetical protein
MPLRQFLFTLMASMAIFNQSLLSESARGPLRLLSSNPRYFTDGSGKAVFLTGSHTWCNLQEITRLPANPNPAIDFDDYLSFLDRHHHNCFRLWAWENASSFDPSGRITYQNDPLPCQRTGPGNALDGKLKFDLNKFNPEYFDRVRSRTIAARDKGIYVIIMLFQGFSLLEKGHHDDWKGHPCNAANNINHIDGDPNGDGKGIETHSLTIPAILTFQEAYVRRVIDTVNDLDNVLFEITNEDNGSPENTAWQYHMIDFIHRYEKNKPKQHPVGMTHQWPDGKNIAEFNSPAEWVSPGEEGGFQTDPPAADGSKVILNDTDHSFFYTGLQKAGLEGQRAWVWKNFTRGNQTLFMDPYLDPTPWYVTTRNHPVNGNPDPYWEVLRINMGYTRLYADRINLTMMTPQCALASSGYCLATSTAAASEYLVYLPLGPWVSVDLSAAHGILSVEWFNPSTGEVFPGERVTGGTKVPLTAPFQGDAVLYLHQSLGSAGTP